MNPLFLNTILLGGSTADKLVACHGAGFDQIELWQQDLAAASGDASALKQQLDALPLALTDYQVLLDFDGAPDSIRAAKRAEAITMLDTAVKLGATTLLTPGCTRPDCVAERIDEDMGWLADEAASRGLRIAYEGMAWSTVNFTLPAAWALVQRLSRPNIGVVVDAFHIFVRGRDASDLDGIPMDRIFLVQLSDLDHGVDLAHVIDTARHHRLLPGQGHFPISTILTRLQRDHYEGPVGLEVFNDELKAREPHLVARQAMAALKSVWPG